MSARRADRLALVERVADVIRVTPDASANEIYREIGGHRRDVLRALRAFRLVLPGPTLSERPTRFPLDEARR